LSYSFVVKRTSSFIPNYFGILVGEHDRPYFQLDVIPNNVLREDPPFGILRRICSDDIQREPRFLQTGVGSIDRTSLGDLWYADQTEGSLVYIYECSGSAAAFISFRVTDRSVLFIEMIAADQKFKGYGIGSMLMRWAGTFARSCCCTAVELRAHIDRISFYTQFGFEERGEKIDLGDGEVYSLMRKPIIYTGNPVNLMGLRDGRLN
jgi:GNAT superfamily N-acetyltransferase